MSPTSPFSCPSSPFSLAAASHTWVRWPELPVFPLGEEKDYTVWLAHSADPGEYGDGCILGYKEQYLRLRKSSVCQNGRDYVVTKQPSVCPCSLEDFLWYQLPSHLCQPLCCAGGSERPLTYSAEKYSNPFFSKGGELLLLLRKWRHREGTESY